MTAGVLVVVGGGIAGAVCSEELCRLNPHEQGVANVRKLTRTVEEFDIVEKTLADFKSPNLRLVSERATKLDTASKRLTLSGGGTLKYDKLCLCNGATPKVLLNSPRVVVLRDQDTVQSLAARLPQARRVLLVGNGGIALELATALQGLEGRPVQVVWVVRHEHIGDAFFDLDAARFLLTELGEQTELMGSLSAAAALEAVSAAALPAESGASGATPEDNPPASRSQPMPIPLERKQHGNNLYPALSPSSSSSNTMLQGRVSGDYGHAVGPQWSTQLQANVGQANGREPGSSIKLEFGCTVTSLVLGKLSKPGSVVVLQEETKPTPASATGREAGPPLTARLSNGTQYEVDLVVSAIGVEPASAWLASSLDLGSDGGVLVDRELRTSAPDVWAAGDVCSVQEEEQQPHWFQMRLWTQARHMGLFAAHVMSGVADQHASGFAFELFTHATRFFGRKVVCLGLYNGQKLEGEEERDMVTYSRTMEGPNATFVRVLLLKGKMVGAVLIGETDLEETFENLILGGIDLSRYGPALLDPDNELEHIFD